MVWGIIEQGRIFMLSTGSVIKDGTTLDDLKNSILIESSRIFYAIDQLCNQELHIT